MHWVASLKRSAPPPPAHHHHGPIHHSVRIRIIEGDGFVVFRQPPKICAVCIHRSRSPPPAPGHLASSPGTVLSDAPKGVFDIATSRKGVIDMAIVLYAVQYASVLRICVLYSVYVNDPPMRCCFSLPLPIPFSSLTAPPPRTTPRQQCLLPDLPTHSATSFFFPEADHTHICTLMCGAAHPSACCFGDRTVGSQVAPVARHSCWAAAPRITHVVRVTKKRVECACQAVCAAKPPCQ